MLTQYICMGPLSVQNTQTHTYTCIHTHACIVCILGVSIFWRHYPMYFINSSSPSACRSTRLPRRQVPDMEYTHNIQHTNTHTHSTSTTREQRAPSTAIVIIVSKIIIVAICQALCQNGSRVLPVRGVQREGLRFSSLNCERPTDTPYNTESVRANQ